MDQAHETAAYDEALDLVWDAVIARSAAARPPNGALRPEDLDVVRQVVSEKAEKLGVDDGTAEQLREDCAFLLILRAAADELDRDQEDERREHRTEVAT